MRERYFPWSQRAGLMAVLVLMVWLGGGEARTPKQGEDWRSMRSGHFYLVGDADEAGLRQIARKLEEFRAGYLGLNRIPAGEIRDETTTVVVFESNASFVPYKPLDSEGHPRNVGGLFLEGSGDSYIVLTADDGSERSIYHEYTHRVSSHGTAWPLWLREGFAEFYSTLQVRDGGRVVRTGLPIHANLAVLRESDLIPLDVLMGIGRNSSYYTRGPDQALFYAQSWALTHYLMLKRRNGEAQLSEFIRLVSEGGDLEASFEAGFGTDFDAMLGELDRYVRDALTFPIIDQRLVGRIVIDDEWKADPLPEFETLFHLGEVLRRLDRNALARQYFERSVAMAPEYDKAWLGFAAALGLEGDAFAVPEGTLDVVGHLRLLACGTNGVRLTVERQGEILRFAASTMDRVEFVSLDAGIRDSVECGRFSPPPRVLVSYTPDRGSSRPAGTAERVVFLPD